MKELSIEQKAKRYDEALERAKKWFNSEEPDSYTCIVESIFPELYEIEDEKIKKVYRVENEAEQKGLWRKFDGTYQPLFDMLTDGQCKDLPMEDSPIYREGGKRWFASAPSKETLQKWFSKKDLEELVSKGFTISEFEVVGYKKVSDFEYIFTRDNIINRNYLEVSDIYPEQKVFASKVEPKFKVGDWIIHDMGDGRVTPPFQIIEMTNKSYVLDNGECFYFSDTEELYRKWTIQDAKDGDILACRNGWTCIFKRLNDNIFSSHCFMDSEGWFCETGGQAHVLDNSINCHPATKEQRELLFTKLKESGHEWDADKKEIINTL